MNKIFKIAFLLSVITVSMMVSTGCKKDWLTPKPLSIYSPENTLVDLAGFKAALVACSGNLRNEWYGDGSPNISEQIFSEEDVEGTDDKTGPAQNMDNLIKPEAQLNNVDFNKIGWFWTQEYIGIREANVIISRLAASKLSDADKNFILGSAYYFRAYDYYRLTNQFGDVPCPTKEVTTAKLDFVTVKREVILTKMKQDLESTLQYVPWTADKGDVNRGAVYHLLTKINLSLGLFDDAIASSSAVISQGAYKLMNSRFGVDGGVATRNVIWDLHRPDNKSAGNNTEVLYLVTDRQGTPGAFGGGIQTMRNGIPFSSVGLPNIKTPTGKLGMPASQGGTLEIDNLGIFGRGIGRCRLTPYSYKDIWDDANDLRHDSTSGNWMYMENIRYNDLGLKSSNDTNYGKRFRLYDQNGNILCADTLRDWFPWPHYKLYVPDTENNPQRGGHTDWYVFRLAETYLLRAEAYVWKGDLASAAADVNAVRTRAKCAPYTAAQMSISTVLDERARELYFEEPRKTELTRIAFIYAKTGKAADNGKTYTLANFSTANFFIDRVLAKNIFYAKNFVTVHGDVMKISPYHVLWPVPQDAINANSGNHINQNAGYNGSANNVAASDKIVD